MNGSSCSSARSPRTQWPGQGGKNGQLWEARRSPRPTYSACVILIGQRLLILPPHYLLSQDHSCAGRTAAYSITARGLQPLLTASPGSGNSILVMHADSVHPRGPECWRPQPQAQRSEFYSDPLGTMAAPLFLQHHCPLNGQGGVSRKQTEQASTPAWARLPS